MRRTCSLPTKDWLIIGMLAGFTTVALTIELYWILHRTEVARRTDLLARLLAIYWPADRTYRDPVLDSAQAFTLALETIHVFVSQWLQAALVVGILQRAVWRYWLQLVLGTYTAYGTLLYYWVAHLSGYAVMPERTAYAFVLFFGVNLPWLIGYAYLVGDAIAAIHRRFRVGAAGSVAATAGS